MRIYSKTIYNISPSFHASVSILVWLSAISTVDLRHIHRVWHIASIVESIRLRWSHIAIALNRVGRLRWWLALDEVHSDEE